MTVRRSVRRSPALWLLLAALSAPAGRAMAESDPEQLERIERDVGDTRKRLSLVRQYAERGEIAPVERANQRYSEAETQFLLDNFEGCAALLLDVMDVAEFKAGPKYPQALYYLAESFYQTEAFIESLRYYRLAIQKLPVGKVYQDSLVRLLDLSERTGDYVGLDQSFDALRRAGNVRSEVTYLYGKWLAHRRDLPADARFPRADAEFALIAPGQAFHPQALYFRGTMRVVQVQALQARLAELTRKERPGYSTPAMDDLKARVSVLLEESAGFFQQILALPEPSKPDPKLKKARDLSNLALARILYEQGKLPEAADRYNEVARESEDYNDALFETTAAYVKMGNYEQALRTSEILLIIGRDSPILPEAKILQANLHLKLGQYDKAAASFADVANDYSPVYSQIKALLAHPNPVEYFDEILHKSGKEMDILQLLPAQARPFVKLDKQVSEARVISTELALGKRGIEESRALAKKLLETLDSGRLQVFPQLQEGNQLAIEQSNRLGGLEGELVKLQLRLLGDRVPPEVSEGLARLDDERKRLDKRFQNLPKTQEQYAERKAAFLGRITELDKLAFSLANKVSELRANLVGLQLYWKSTRQQRTLSPTLETERQDEFAQTLTLIEQLEEERLRIVQEIELERVTISGQVAGGDIEEELRGRYRQLLDSTQQLVAKALPVVPEANRPLLNRVQQARGEVDKLQSELAALRGRIRERAVARADEYRKEVLAQQQALEGYARESESVDGRTRRLLGEIAHDSFSRVGKQFYELVLKADVGIIDVAWTRKKDRSDRISQLGRDKDGEIQRLQDRFKEVLNDAD